MWWWVIGCVAGYLLFVTGIVVVVTILAKRSPYEPGSMDEADTA